MVRCYLINHLSAIFQNFYSCSSESIYLSSFKGKVFTVGKDPNKLPLPHLLGPVLQLLLLVSLQHTDSRLFLEAPKHILGQTQASAFTKALWLQMSSRIACLSSLGFGTNITIAGKVHSYLK